MQDEKTPEPAEPTPTKRRRRWPLVLLVVVIVIAFGAWIAWYQAGGKLRFTEPYKAALALASKDPQVIAKLGQPIEQVWLPPSGSIYGENAHLLFKIQGPNGRAAVLADARMIGGKWALRPLNVTFDDQKRISIDTASMDGGDGGAPKWTPPPTVAPKGGDAPKAGGEPVKVAPPASPSPDIQLDMPDVGSSQPPPAKK